MTYDLNDDTNAHLNVFQGKVWFTAFNGCGAVLRLEPEQAKEIGLALYHAARKIERELVAGRT